MSHIWLFFLAVLTSQLAHQEILRNTPKTHPDYPEIEATIDKVKHVADSINKSTALQENFNKMLEVTDRLTGFDVSLRLTGVPKNVTKYGNRL